MGAVKWIKLSVGLPDNRKIKQIRKMPEGDTIALMWVFLMCLAGETNDDGAIYFTPEIPFTDEMLADQFSMDIKTVRLALATFQRFGMIEVVDDIIRLDAWEKWQATEKLSEIREYNRLAKQKSRAKQKLLKSVNDMSLTCQPGHDTDKEEEKERERDKENIYSGDDVSAGGENSPLSDVEKLQNAISAYCKKYFNRAPTDFEIDELTENVRYMHQVTGQPCPPLRFEEDEEELLRLAFESAAKAGAKNISYINGVFRRMWNRGIHTVSDYYDYEFQKDQAAGVV